MRYIGMVWLFATLMGTFAIGADSPASVADVAGDLAQWTAHVEKIRKDPSLVACYSPKTGLPTIPNLVGGGSAGMTYQAMPVAGATASPLKRVLGRWPGQSAVQLDQGALVAPLQSLSGRAFTSVLWIRKQGQGAHRGNSGMTNGMIMAVGNGYWEGWRLTAEYPSQVIGFEIGRPQPSSSVGVGTSTISDGVWHHLAATWDGQVMRLYVDGALIASRPYAGVYTPPAQSNATPLHIGYSNSGVGSAILDVDHVAIYDRALTEQQVFSDYYFHARITDQQAELWTAAGMALTAGDSDAATKALTSLLSLPGLHPDLATSANLRLIFLRLDAGTIAHGDASAQLITILNNPKTPARSQVQSMAELLNMVRQGSMVSPELAKRLLASPQADASDRLALRLVAGDALAAQGDMRAAAISYIELADDTNVSATWRGLAYLCAARASAAASNYSAAKASCQKIMAMASLPPHRIAEAKGLLLQFERQAAGKPAIEPADSHTELPRLTPAMTLHVAPQGSDQADGSAARPFATLAKARDHIRSLRKTARPLPDGGVEVVVQGGRYSVRETFVLEAVDSGTATAPIIYRAAKGQMPCFDAGATISGFAPVTDPAILQRLPDLSRGKVLFLDLKTQAIPAQPPLERGGFASARGFVTHASIELFCDGKAMPLARWPNDRFVTIAAGVEGRKDAFVYSDDRIDRWAGEKEAWLFGYWFYDWADSYEKIATIDTRQKTVTLAAPYTLYGGAPKAEQRFYGVNLLCEIDAPGEWYLDREAGRLYFLPPADQAESPVQVSLFDKPVVKLEGVSHVRFEGLTWENGQGDGIIIADGADCVLEGCTIRQFGGNAVEIRGGKHHLLLSCDLHTLGRGGAVVAGGDRKTLTPGLHQIGNCHIYDFSRIDHTYTPAVLLDGVGNRISHNLVHDSFSSAFRVEGNDHLIEYNDVHHVLLESDDQGAADMWANPTFRGNVYRYNHWHDLGNGLGVGQAGIRLDDAISGTVIYGNIFVRSADGGMGAVQIHGGKDNYVENNLFVACKAGVSFSPWGQPRWELFLDGHAKSYLQAVDITMPPYSMRYPALANLKQNCDANSIGRNVAVGCNTFLLRNNGLNDLMANWNTTTNPGLVNPAAGNYAVAPRLALAARLSFVPIPVAQIGLYPSVYRMAK